MKYVRNNVLSFRGDLFEMKKILLILLVVFLAVLLPSCRVPEEKQTVKIGLEESLIPYCYYNNESEIESIENKSFSKLKVKEKLVELGIWETLKNSLSESEYEDLLLAKDLAFDNVTFVKFYNQLKEQIPNIDAILMECI